MTLKKQKFDDEEIPIFDEAVIYKRGAYWQFRMWLVTEGKYARKSLRTRSQSTAIEKGKDCYLEILANQRMGKKYFSLTIKEGVQKYLDHRFEDIGEDGITEGRFGTIKTHLQHFLSFIDNDTKLKELGCNDCEKYFRFRKLHSKRDVKRVTILNEQSTINSCIKYLFRINEVYIDAFYFKKFKNEDGGKNLARRDIFENEEYERIYRVMRTYCSNSSNKIDEKEIIKREIVRHYILIAANSGLRVGEQRQLRWSDVSTERKNKNGEDLILARIRVRKLTSKVRKEREFYCRNGQYFDRLRKILKHKDDNSLIFSVDGKTTLSKRAVLYHFHKILELADIKDRIERNLVPYSLRHFMITQRVMSGLDYAQVAHMTGTSRTQIEKTYFHLNEKILLTNAMADYRVNEDGTIELT